MTQFNSPHIHRPPPHFYQHLELHTISYPRHNKIITTYHIHPHTNHTQQNHNNLTTIITMIHYRSASVPPHTKLQQAIPKTKQPNNKQKNKPSNKQYKNKTMDNNIGQQHNNSISISFPISSVFHHHNSS